MYACMNLSINLSILIYSVEFMYVSIYLSVYVSLYVYMYACHSVYSSLSIYLEGNQPVRICLYLIANTHMQTSFI